MSYQATQEFETTIPVTNVNSPTAAKTEALHIANKELSILQDDPRIHNYDLFSATINDYPLHIHEQIPVTVAFTLTTTIHTDDYNTVPDASHSQMDNALSGLFNEPQKVGAPAVSTVN